MKKTSTAFLFFCSFNLSAQLVYDNMTYDKRVQTVQLMKDGTDDRYPIISLNSADQLRLSFDLTEKTNDYFQYTIIHCDANWLPTNLASNFYMKGMSFDNVTDFKFSTNTYTKYVHYNIVFPNENITLTAAGNYIIKVYKNFNEDDLVLSRRFMILNNNTSLDGNARPATLAEYRFTKQELNFTIEYNVQQIPNPLADVKVVILQNNHWDGALRGLPPQFAFGNKLDYNYQDKTLFNGGNEYRFFDTRQIRAFSTNVRSKFTDSVVHAILNTDEPRSSQQYMLWLDYDGKRIIQNKEGQNTATSSETDADYVWMTFYLSTTSAMPENSGVFVFGEFTDWKLKPEYKMYFNSARGRYECEIPLKQGRYEYSYAVFNTDTKMPDETVIEGNHAQTENEYLILVYTRNLQFSFDELIGVKKINTTTQ